MDVHLDLNMTMIRPLDGLRQVEYLKEFGDIYKRLEKHLEPVLVNQEQWKRDKPGENFPPPVALTKDPEIPGPAQQAANAVNKAGMLVIWVNGRNENVVTTLAQANKATLIHPLRARTRTHDADTPTPDNHPTSRHDEALGVDVKSPRHPRNNVMKNSVMWLGAFLQGTATGQ